MRRLVPWLLFLAIMALPMIVQAFDETPTADLTEVEQPDIGEAVSANAFDCEATALLIGLNYEDTTPGIPVSVNRADQLADMVQHRHPLLDVATYSDLVRHYDASQAVTERIEVLVSGDSRRPLLC